MQKFVRHHDMMDKFQISTKNFSLNAPHPTAEALQSSFLSRYETKNSHYKIVECGGTSQWVGSERARWRGLCHCLKIIPAAAAAAAMCTSEGNVMRRFKQPKQYDNDLSLWFFFSLVYFCFLLSIRSAIQHRHQRWHIDENKKMETRTGKFPCRDNGRAYTHRHTYNSGYIILCIQMHGKRKLNFVHKIRKEKCG